MDPVPELDEELLKRFLRLEEEKKKREEEEQLKRNLERTVQEEQSKLEQMVTSSNKDIENRDYEINASMDKNYKMAGPIELEEKEKKKSDITVL